MRDLYRHRTMLLALLVTLVSSCTVPAAGLEPGARLASYAPKHLTGPDKGTRQCPPCKYAAGPFVQIFINGDSDENIKALTLKLEATLAGKNKLHGAVVMMDETRRPDIEKWVKEWNLEKTALCYVLVGIRGSVARDYKLEDAKNVLIISDEKKVLRSVENASVEDFERALKAL